MKTQKSNLFIADAAFDKENQDPIEFYLTSLQKLSKRKLDHSIEKVQSFL